MKKPIKRERDFWKIFEYSIKSAITIVFGMKIPKYVLYFTQYFDERDTTRRHYNEMNELVLLISDTRRGLQSFVNSHSQNPYLQ